MSPQPTAVPQTAAERQIARAEMLLRETVKVRKQVDANRKYLRLMAENDELTDEQEDWLDAFYPSKEKGERRSQEEVEATRKIKEAALKAA